MAKPVETGLRLRRSDVLTLLKSATWAVADGHEIKLAGETGDAGRSVTLLAEHVTEADKVRPYLSNSRSFPKAHLR